MSVYPCKFRHISVSFACMGLNFFRRARGAMGMVRTLKNSLGSGDITKELMWMFDIDYVTQNNRSL